MINTILTAVLLVVTIGIGFLLTYFLLKMRRLEQNFKDFTLPPKEGEASPASILLQNASAVIGKSVALEIKTTLMGKASAAARQEAGITADIAHDALASNQPLLAGLVDSFPSLKKRLGANPQLMSVLISQLGDKLLKPKSPDDGNSSKDGFAAKRGIF